MKTSKILSALLIGMTLTACSDVDICESKHPHEAEARFSFDFGSRETSKPDNMGVLAYRIVGQQKQLATVNTTTFKINNRDSLAIPVGEYRFYTLPLDDKEIDYSELDEFVNGNSIDRPIHSVGLTYRDYDISDPDLRSKLTEWDDFNPYAKYMQADLKPLFYDSTQVINVERDQQVQHTFHPSILTQNIEINFNIDKKSNGTEFMVDKVWAEISGVPKYINISNCHLDITQTAKVMFPVTLTAADNSEGDSFANKTIKCQGNIDVTGLVNVQRGKGDTDNDVKRKIHGPGIMQVIIYGHAIDPVSGRTRHKKWQGIINLYEPIRRADLMYTSPDGSYSMRKKEAGVIDINARLTLDGEKIVSDAADDNGIGQWIPTVDILLDI